MAVSDNEKILNKGFSKGLAMIERTIMVSLHYSMIELVHTALYNREYMGFTGNTQTSYTCGAYLNGVLVDVVNSGESLPKPVRRKIPFGKTVYLERPYEGKPRAREGMVSVDRNYGADTALKFLNSYHAPKKGFALVMTTGTEYSEFLEQQAGLDVLTKTFKDASGVIARNWRKIPD